MVLKGLLLHLLQFGASLGSGIVVVLVDIDDDVVVVDRRRGMRAAGGAAPRSFALAQLRVAVLSPVL